MNGSWTRWTTCFVLAGLLGSAGVADRPQKLFEELFGAEARKVAATRDRDDDVQFASKLLDAGRSLSDDPELRTHLLVKAFEFAVRDQAGYRTARAAVVELLATAAARHEEWQAKRLELCRLEYQQAKRGKSRSRKSATIAGAERLAEQLVVVGDLKAGRGLWREALSLYQQARSYAAAAGPEALRKRVAERHARATLMGRLESLKARLEKAPDDVEARMAVIRFYVLSLDEPQGAIPYLDAAVDEAWRTYVALAARPPAKLAAEACVELGNWYATLAQETAGTQRQTLGARARRYYWLYLHKARMAQVDEQRIVQARERLNVALKELGQPLIRGGSRSIDPAVEEALDKAAAHLWGRQEPSGRWFYGSGSRVTYSPSVNSRVAAALLACGTSVDDARLANVLKWLGEVARSGSNGTSSLWAAAARQSPDRFRELLAESVKQRLRTSVHEGKRQWQPFYEVRVRAGTREPSRIPATTLSACEFVLVAQVVAEAGIAVPKGFWQNALAYWTTMQKADGQWWYSFDREYLGSYSPAYLEARGKVLQVTHTAAGVAGVAISLKHLHGEAAMRDSTGKAFAPLGKGLAWLEANVSGVRGRIPDKAHDATVSRMFRYLSGAGIAVGATRFGGFDWAEEGTRYFLRLQRDDGSWGSSLTTTATTNVVGFLLNAQRTQTGMTVAVAKVPLPAVSVDGPERKAAKRRIESLAVGLSDPATRQAAAQEIARLYLVELRDPAAAAKYAAMSGDKDLQAVISLAAEVPSAVTALQCFQLGAWYEKAAATGGSSARESALSLAERYLREFLRRCSKHDATELKAKLLLGKVQKARRELARPGPSR